MKSNRTKLRIPPRILSIDGGDGYEDGIVHVNYNFVPLITGLAQAPAISVVDTSNAVSLQSNNINLRIKNTFVDFTSIKKAVMRR